MTHPNSDHTCYSAQLVNHDSQHDRGHFSVHPPATRLAKTVVQNGLSRAPIEKLHAGKQS